MTGPRLHRIESSHPRYVRGRDDRLADSGIPMRPGAIVKCARMTSAERVAIDVPVRGKRRRIVAKLPLLQIVDDRDGPTFGDLESDADPSIVMIHEEEEPLAE